MKIEVEDIISVFLAHTPTESLRYSKVMDVLCALSQYQQELRALIKYGDPETQFKTHTEAVDWCRDKLYCCLQDYNIDIDELLN